jgi:putative transposase
MGIAHFHQGVTLQIDGIQHRLNRELDKGLWQTEEIKTGRLHTFKLGELQSIYASGQLTFFDKTRPVSEAALNINASKIISFSPEPPAADWDRAKVRRAYVKAVEYLPVSQPIMVAAIWQVWNKIRQPPCPPHWVTVAGWKSKYQKHGNNAFALVDNNKRKGNRTRRYPQEVIVIVEEAIDRIYMKRERMTVQDTLEEAIVLVKKENDLLPEDMQLPTPTRRIVDRAIQEIAAFDRWAARYGRTAAIRKFRAKLRYLATKSPLESAEIDHTKLDLFVVNDDGIPLGRPWLTICIDCHTRCILGIYIGFVPPSYLSVAKCLKHAFLPKTNLREEYPSIRHEWAAHGVMEKLIVDNGLEFHSDSLDKACYMFGIEIEYMPRKTPWFKGKIERFNRTINEGVSHGIKGTTFRNTFEKDDYNPAEHAVVTLGKLREIMHKWIADYYHQKPHRSLDDISPAAMWTSSIRTTDIPLAEDPAKIDVLLGKSLPDKSLTHKGIEVNRLLYNSPELVGLRRQYGSELKVEARIDEENIGRIFVMLPDGSGYLIVPALNQDYAEGLSLWLHNICRKYAKLHHSVDDPYHWALAKTEIREIVQQELHLKHKKTHGRIARHQESDSASAKPAQKRPPVVKTKTPITIDIKPSNPATRPRFKAVIENRGKQA